MSKRDPEALAASVDSLAQELSKQNLRLDRANLAQLQLQLSLPSGSPPLPCISPIPPCPDLEIDDEPTSYPETRRRDLSSAAVLLPESMQLDPSLVAQDTKRLRRQRSSQYNNNPNNARTIQAMVEDMISSGSQCNVRPSPPPLTPTSATMLGPILEPDNGMKFDVDCLGLQVDDSYVNGLTPDVEKDERSLIETMMSLRRAGAPGGVRKMGVLQYRASADAALSCANVVRSRPRMRRRHGPHHRSSKASSAISSAISSPVVPPSLDDGSRITFGEL
jgi:hypothetical protein